MSAITENRRTQFSLRDLFGLTTFVAILAAVGSIPQSASSEEGNFLLRACVTLLAIYVVRLRILKIAKYPDPRAIGSSSFRVNGRILQFIAYSLSLLALIGYVYWCLVPWDSPDLSPPAKWVGLPVGIFAVPTASFLIFDNRGVFCSSSAFAECMLVEIFFVVPAWYFVWVLLQLIVLEWIAI